MPHLLQGATSQGSKESLRWAQEPFEKDGWWTGNRQGRLCLPAEYSEVARAFLNQSKRLKAVNSMDVRISPVVVIKMRRKLAMMVVI